MFRLPSFHQAAAKVAAFGPLFSGLAIDEIAPASMINFDPASCGAGADGGARCDVIWCGQPCRQLLRGWQRLASRVAEVVYGVNSSGGATGSGTAITVNYIGAQRIDVLAAADGVFTEDYVEGAHNALVNAVGLSTTGKPLATVWTYAMPALALADDYFAAHL